MTEAAANAGTQPASDSVQTPLTLDDAAALDFDDPAEDNNEVQAEPQSGADDDNREDETPGDQDESEADDTGDDGEEGDEGETAEEDPADEAQPVEPPDDSVVTVNGEQIALRDLKAGYMQQADYTRKTQDLSNRRRDLEALTARVTSSVDVLADFLVKQIPPAPDASLAVTNPGEFVRKKALHDAARQQIDTLLQQAGDVKSVSKEMDQQQRAQMLEAENAKLAEIFPSVATGDGRKKFFDDASQAAKELGYTDEEIASAVDHRMFALAHYARIGMQAEKARAKATKKVQNAPPVAPPKRSKSQNTKAAQNRKAMERLSQTGSIHDALGIDWE